jgi:hypothetical protein
MLKIGGGGLENLASKKEASLYLLLKFHKLLVLIIINY